MLGQLRQIAATLCTLLIPVATFAADASSTQEIRVQLSTASALQPVYLGYLQVQSASLSAHYTDQLDAILQHNLNYNGATKLSPRAPEKEKILNARDSAMTFHPATWKQMGIPYVLRWQVKEHALSLALFNTQNGEIKNFNELPLSGDIHQDRRQIHKLADAIHKAIFGTEGIANTRILFSYQASNPKPDGGDWISEIWECDWDGANLRQVTNEGSYTVTPVLLPRHPRYGNDRFLYVSYKNGQPKIFIASLKEGKGKRLVDLRGNQLLPAISPQRDKIAFICDAGGRTDLFMQPLHPDTGDAGKPIQLYSYPRSTQASPTFSPDGSKIAFVSDKDGGMRIFLIPATPMGKRANASMLTKKNRENSCPAWSPDGTKLAYSAKTSGIRQIWIYDFATGEEWQLTSGPGNKENPSWGPDSKHIIFNSTDGSASELYVVNLNQPEAIKITRGPGKKHYPTWGTR